MLAEAIIHVLMLKLSAILRKVRERALEREYRGTNAVSRHAASQPGQIAVEPQGWRDMSRPGAVSEMRHNVLRRSTHQKATKLRERHCLRSGSTGFRSSFVSRSCVFVRPGSAFTRSFSVQLAIFESRSFSMIAEVQVDARLVARPGCRSAVYSEDDNSLTSPQTTSLPEPAEDRALRPVSE